MKKIIRNKDCKECPQNNREDEVWMKGFQDGWECAKANPYQGSPRFYEILEELKKLHDKKSQNYGTDQDSLSNLRQCERMEIPAWKGCLLRMLDKVSRLVELSKGKEDLVNEPIIDTLRDLAVYTVICEVLYEEKND